MITTIIVATFLTIVLGAVYASLFEWVVHKYFLHTPLRGIRYPYRMHTHVHHRIFSHDETYVLQNPDDRHKIHMLKWSPIVIFCGSLPFIAVSIIFAYIAGVSIALTIFLTGIILASSYYLTYEYLHWCMHNPKNRLIEKTHIFRWLNTRHIMHHTISNKNLNVIIPLADLAFGTFISNIETRSLGH